MTKLQARAMAQVRREFPDATQSELMIYAAELENEWAIDAAWERDMYGIPEDTPCLTNADLWGTGEGRYHGVM